MTKNGWTPERKAKQAEAIRRWAPWEKSTGPKSEEGKAAASQRAFRGGVRPKVRECKRLIRQIKTKVAEARGEK